MLKQTATEHLPLDPAASRGNTAWGCPAVAAASTMPGYAGPRRPIRACDHPVAFGTDRWARPSARFVT